MGRGAKGSAHSRWRLHDTVRRPHRCVPPSCSAAWRRARSQSPLDALHGFERSSAAQQNDSSAAGTADASLLDLTRASIVTPTKPERAGAHCGACARCRSREAHHCTPASCEAVGRRLRFVSPTPRKCSARESHKFLVSGRNERRTPATRHRARLSDLKPPQDRHNTTVDGAGTALRRPSPLLALVPRLPFNANPGRSGAIALPVVSRAYGEPDPESFMLRHAGRAAEAVRCWSSHQRLAGRLGFEPSSARSLCRSATSEGECETIPLG